MMKSIVDASEISGLPYSLIRNLCINHKIKFIRSGVKYYINMESLIEYCNRGDED